MGPKRASEGAPSARQRARVAAKAQPQPAAGEGVVPKIEQRRDQEVRDVAGLTEAEQTINADFYHIFEEAINRLFGDPAYEGIQDLPPLKPDEGGCAPFSQSDYGKALTGGGCYEFTGNLFYHKLRWRPVPTTPINKSGIDSLIAHHYGKGAPHRVAFEVVCAMDKDWVDVASHFGQLRRVSPEEPVFALLLAAANETDPDQKVQYKRLMRSVKYVCQHMVDESVIVRESINIREQQTTASKHNT